MGVAGEVAMAVSYEFGAAVRSAEKSQKLARREVLRNEWEDYLKKEENKPFVRGMINSYYNGYLGRDINNVR